MIRSLIWRSNLRQAAGPAGRARDSWLQANPLRLIQCAGPLVVRAQKPRMMTPTDKPDVEENHGELDADKGDGSPENT